MQKIQNSYSIGLWHEIKAQKLLESKGYTTLHHNYRGKVAQIDLIMKSKKYLAFVEVKKTNLKYKHNTLEKFLRKQKKRILGELYLFYKTKPDYKNYKPVLILLIFAKTKQPDLYLYYLTP